MKQYFFVAALLISAIILPQQALGASLKKTTVKKGDCSQVAKNDVRVFVHYTGTLEDGTKYAERRWCLGSFERRLIDVLVCCTGLIPVMIVRHRCLSQWGMDT